MADRTWIAVIEGEAEDQRPMGVAVVIDSRRVLTAAHVILDRAPEVQANLWVRFPMAPDGMNETRRRVIEVRMTPKARASSNILHDVAVLELDELVPIGVCAARLRIPNADDLSEKRWWAFGFPDEDSPLGSSADGTIGDLINDGWIRLESRKTDYRLAEGYSGSGLWSADFQAVVGVIAKASGHGNGQGITLELADRLLKDEKIGLIADRFTAEDPGEQAMAAWGWELAADEEAGLHWRPRARGVAVESEAGFRFRGRAAALNKIIQWITDQRPDHRALVVTGSPGVGKSAVLGRIVTTADAAIVAELPAADTAVRAPVGSVACAVHAKGKTAMDVALEIARAASARLPERPEDLLLALRPVLERRRARGNGRSFVLVIDALDEADTPEQTREIITKIILPVLATYADQGVKIVVGTRPVYRDGALLNVFGSRIEQLNLDEPDYFEFEDLTSYVTATLQLVGDERRDNPYADQRLAEPVARKIAELSAGNFLIAGLVARTHGLHDTVAAEVSDLWVPQDVSVALRQYLRQLGSIKQVPAEEALAVLALAEPPGLPLELWQAALAAVAPHSEISVPDLERFVSASAANFLVESASSNAIGATSSAYRLYHQALNDALLEGGPDARGRRSAAEEAICDAFIEFGRRTGWHQAPDYLLRSLPTHAANAGRIDQLLLDDDYLLHANLTRLTSMGDNTSSEAGRRRARLLHLTPTAVNASADERTSLFSITEALDYLGDSYITSPKATRYRAAWAKVVPRTEWSVLGVHADADSPPSEESAKVMTAVCGFTLGHQVCIAGARSDGLITIWDAATGEHRSALVGQHGRVNRLCSFSTGKDVLIASVGDDRRIHLWEAAAGTSRPIVAAHQGAVYGICVFNLDGPVVLATAGSDRLVRLWQAESGEEIRSLSGHKRAVYAVCSLEIDGRVVVASAGIEGVVRLWDAATGAVYSEFALSERSILSLCPFELDGRLLLAAGATDGVVTVADARTGELVLRLNNAGQRVSSVCEFDFSGRPLVAAASEDGELRLWDATSGQLYSAMGHDAGGVMNIAPVTINGRLLIAGACGDGAVRLWDAVAADPGLRRDQAVEHVNAVTTAVQAGRGMVASASDDRLVRLHAAATGEELRRLVGHDEGVSSVCAFRLDGTLMLASVGKDRTVRTWHPANGRMRQLLTGHTQFVNSVCAFELAGRTLLASAGDDARVIVWDARTGDRIKTLMGHRSPVLAVCSFTSRGEVFLAGAGKDKAALVWAPATDDAPRKLQFPDTVRALASITLDGQAMLIAAAEHSIQIVDAEDGTQHNTLPGHTGIVTGVCVIPTRDQVFLATTSADCTVRIWEPLSGTCVEVIPVHHPATGAAWCDGMLVVGLKAGLLGLKPDMKRFSAF